MKIIEDSDGQYFEIDDNENAVYKISKKKFNKIVKKHNPIELTPEKVSSAFGMGVNILLNSDSDELNTVTRSNRMYLDDECFEDDALDYFYENNLSLSCDELSAKKMAVEKYETNCGFYVVYDAHVTTESCDDEHDGESVFPKRAFLKSLFCGKIK